MTNYIGFLLVVYGPWKLTCDPDTAFGRWCLSHAGAWAYSHD